MKISNIYLGLMALLSSFMILFPVSFNFVGFILIVTLVFVIHMYYKFDEELICLGMKVLDKTKRSNYLE
jgi:hypothetical protein